MYCFNHNHAMRAFAGRNRHLAGMLWLTLSLMVPLAPLQAQIESLEISPDITTSLPTVTGTILVSSNTSLIEIDPLTGQAIDGQNLLAGAPFINPVVVDAYDGSLNAFSIDIAAEVTVSSGTFFMRPGEIYTQSGVLLFDPVAAGLPENTNVDAISMDPVSGDLVFSVSNYIGSPQMLQLLPSDLFRWNGSNLFLFFDGFRVPRELNLDAAHVLDNGNILMSFDTSGRIDSKDFRDEELLEYDPVGDSFALFAGTLDIAVGAPDWFPADLDALHVIEAAGGFSIGGTVSGLVGSGLVLRNNGADDLPISANGSFTFATPVPDGDSYNVTVASQPSAPAQNCTVSNGAGTVSGANVTNVQVTCVTGGQVQFVTAVAEVMEDIGNLTVTINRIGGSSGATSFRVQTVAGSATSGSDYGAVNQVLNWISGDSSSRTVTIPIINDGAAEAATEQFTVSLSKESGSAVLGTPALVTVTIFDNETVQFADGFEGEP